MFCIFTALEKTVSADNLFIACIFKSIYFNFDQNFRKIIFVFLMLLYFSLFCHPIHIQQNGSKLTLRFEKERDYRVSQRMWPFQSSYFSEVKMWLVPYMNKAQKVGMITIPGILCTIFHYIKVHGSVLSLLSSPLDQGSYPWKKVHSRILKMTVYLCTNPSVLKPFSRECNRDLDWTLKNEARWFFLSHFWGSCCGSCKTCLEFKIKPSNQVKIV